MQDTKQHKTRCKKVSVRVCSGQAFSFLTAFSYVAWHLEPQTRQFIFTKKPSDLFCNQTGRESM